MKLLKRFIARFVLWFSYDYCFKHLTPPNYGEHLGRWGYCRKCKNEWEQGKNFEEKMAGWLQ